MVNFVTYILKIDHEVINEIYVYFIIEIKVPFLLYFKHTHKNFETHNMENMFLMI